MNLDQHPLLFHKWYLLTFLVIKLNIQHCVFYLVPFQSLSIWRTELECEVLLTTQILDFTFVHCPLYTNSVLTLDTTLVRICSEMKTCLMNLLMSVISHFAFRCFGYLNDIDTLWIPATLPLIRRCAYHRSSVFWAQCQCHQQVA